MKHYYNEHNAYRAAVLRERIEEGLLPEGIVDERNIEEIPDQDFLGWTQIHLFAGIGGFPLGLRLAGFPENRRIVTGGFPCQDISNAGKRAGISGSRSGLWREMVRCVRVVRPELVFVENVAALLCRGMGEVLGDLAAIGYDAEGDCVSAADVGAPHLRRRIWIVAYAVGGGVRNQSIIERWRDGAPVVEHAGESPDASIGGARSVPAGSWREGQGTIDADWHSEDVPDADTDKLPEQGNGESELRLDEIYEALPYAECGDGEGLFAWSTDSEDGRGSDERQIGLSLRGRCEPWKVEPDVGRVAHGIPRRVDRLAALGDAIVPQCVAEVLKKIGRANVSR
jgi:DNA (cytosine-5)-methyltransferase 1